MYLIYILREVIHKKKIRKYVFCIKGGGGGRTPNLNFLDFIFGRLLNLVTEKFSPIFCLNFRGEGGGLKKFRRNTYFRIFFLLMTSLTNLKRYFWKKRNWPTRLGHCYHHHSVSPLFSFFFSLRLLLFTHFKESLFWHN